MYCRAVDEKGRQARGDRTAAVSDRPEPNRIKERAEAMMEGQLWRERMVGRKRDDKRGGGGTTTAGSFSGARAP